MPKPVRPVDNFYSMLQDFAIDNDLISKLKPVDEVKWTFIPPGGVSQVEHEVGVMRSAGRHDRYEEAIKGEGESNTAGLIKAIKHSPKFKEVFFHAED